MKRSPFAKAFSKLCRKCGRELTSNNFSRLRNGKRQPVCKECEAAIRERQACPT
jgi:NAD-dependent SIR2 family protein deacetylase